MITGSIGPMLSVRRMMCVVGSSNGRSPERHPHPEQSTLSVEQKHATVLWSVLNA